MPSRTGAGVVGVLRLLVRPPARPAQAIYGTVLAAGLIASQDPRFDSTAEIAGTVLITVAVFWLAHGYGHAVGLHLADAGPDHEPGARSVTGRRVAWAALVENWPMARASLLPVGVLVIARLAGAAVEDAQFAAMWTCVALLAVWGFLAGRAAGLRTWRLAGYCAGSSLLGLALIVLEVLIH